MKLCSAFYLKPEKNKAVVIRKLTLYYIADLLALALFPIYFSGNGFDCCHC